MSVCSFITEVAYLERQRWVSKFLFLGPKTQLRWIAVAVLEFSQVVGILDTSILFRKLDSA
jgi:hypothetical protein